MKKDLDRIGYTIVAILVLPSIVTLLYLWFFTANAEPFLPYDLWAKNFIETALAKKHSMTEIVVAMNSYVLLFGISTISLLLCFSKVERHSRLLILATEAGQLDYERQQSLLWLRQKPYTFVCGLFFLIVLSILYYVIQAVIEFMVYQLLFLTPFITTFIYLLYLYVLLKFKFLHF